MIIECPKCGTKNSTDKPPQPGRRYRCGKCWALITFQQTADIPSETVRSPVTRGTGHIVSEKSSIQSRSAVMPKEGRGWSWTNSFKPDSRFYKKSLIILSIVVCISIVGSLGMAIQVQNRIATAQENGTIEGKDNGYSDGYEEGKSIGYDEGNEKGYIEGDAEGYESGLTRGQEEGEEIGYTVGRKEGISIGERAGYEAGEGDGYSHGYTAGFEEIISTDYLVRNPTYHEALEMLDQSMADSTSQINNYFESRGIRTGYVWVNIAKGGGWGSALVAFETLDKNLIIISPLTHKEVELEVGKRFSTLLGYAIPDYDDTITQITIIW